jgi:valyl-tRNA synthetase
MVPEKLLKPYNPQDTENRIYKAWEEAGFFNPDTCVDKGVTDKDAESFTIILPPPNVTGTLHLGHVLGATLQDIAVRFNRMNGKKTLWIPGTDHAAIATQSKVEKDIQKTEKKSRHDLGREEMLNRIDAFAKQSHDTIVSQLKVTGASLDWSREAFTLDEKRNFAVRTIFKQMYDDGLIYRGNRVINWDPKGQTTISDDEIVYEERKATLYTFKYSKDFPIAISTTRPETKVGDTAVAVHPDDARYKQFVGQEFSFDFCGVPVTVKIIADKEVDPEFGTGALGVTPAHSQIDFMMAERHNLPIKQVINEYAKMSVGDERILNKKATEAREAIVEWLRTEGLLIDEKEINQNVATAERTGGIIEPLPKLQWFVAVNKEFTKHGKTETLKDIMRNAVATKQVEINPEHFSKTYFHWIDNLKDWCISRQIWYGHRIPVWYKGDEKSPEIYCGITAPEGEGWRQDEDTLDTWFSSGLWTFSTLGWPDNLNDLKVFHPTNLLVTAYEILFFWVARMIMMTGYALDQIPFKKVLITGIVRDAKGVKFSKSLGNGIDPIDMANKFSMDATRIALVFGTAPGTDMKISEDKIKGYRNFGNKLWNITRFILTGLEDFNESLETSSEKLVPADQKIIDDHGVFLADITKDISEYRYHLASEKIYHYIWNTLADVIIEDSKAILANESDAAAKLSRQIVLATLLRDSITVLHPFMPFVTEELWGLLPKYMKMNDNMLIVQKWPVKQ